MPLLLGLLVIDRFGTDSEAINKCTRSGGKEAGNPMHVDDTLTILGIVHASIGKARCTARNKSH